MHNYTQVPYSAPPGLSSLPARDILEAWPVTALQAGTNHSQLERLRAANLSSSLLTVARWCAGDHELPQ